MTARVDTPRARRQRELAELREVLREVCERLSGTEQAAAAALKDTLRNPRKLAALVACVTFGRAPDVEIAAMRATLAAALASLPEAHSSLQR